MKPRIHFLGASGTVTGSKFLVEAEGKSILIDCGPFQGPKDLRLRNWTKPPFEPKNLSAVILTHAHIDHTGYLPLLLKLGYRGPIYCTPPTKALLALLLPDSAHLQEEEARYANLHGTSKHHPAKPLYTEEEALMVLSYLTTFERNTVVDLFPKISFSSTCAGHILGAVSLNLNVGTKRITFSGDVGRYGSPILPDPQPLEFGDLLLCESTYGDRFHEKGKIEEDLTGVIKKALIKKGPLLIPAFAIGRTQTLLYHLAQLERQGAIPVLPVYVDSPMAIDATSIYRRFQNDYDSEAKALIALGEAPLLTNQTTFCQTVEQSKSLNHMSGARIIIAASGMVNGGRILHHMKNHLADEKTTVLFVGYQGDGTRGRRIQSGEGEVKIFGSYVKVSAEICTISSLSAHGDQEELIRWLKSCKGSPSQVKIIHGEPEASQVFTEKLKESFNWNVSPAAHLETVEV